MLLHFIDLFSDSKTLQILWDCGNNVSWQSTGNHICCFVRHPVYGTSVAIAMRLVAYAFAFTFSTDVIAVAV